MKSKTPGLSHMQSASTIRCLNTWDEAKRQQTLQNHDIDLADLDGFFDGDVLTREDVRETYGEVRYQTIGVFNGVALFVAWTPRGKQGDIIPGSMRSGGEESIRRIRVARTSQVLRQGVTRAMRFSSFTASYACWSSL